MKFHFLETIDYNLLSRNPDKDGVLDKGYIGDNIQQIIQNENTNIIWIFSRAITWSSDIFRCLSLHFLNVW